VKGKMTSMAEIPGNLSYTNVEGELLRRFPELEAKVQQEFGSYCDLENERPGNYLVFEDIVFPFIKEIAGEEGKEKIAEELFDFFEQMANSPDSQLLDLLGIAITEQLAWHQLLDKFDRFIGPNTRRMVSRDMKVFEEHRTKVK
jgi:hypothetical protein